MLEDMDDISAEGLDMLRRLKLINLIGWCCCKGFCYARRDENVIRWDPCEIVGKGTFPAESFSKDSLFIFFRN